MTFNVSQSGLTPVFQVLDANTDDVIGFINYIIERGANEPTPRPGKTKKNKPKTKTPGSRHDAFWDYI